MNFPPNVDPVHMIVEDIRAWAHGQRERIGRFFARNVARLKPRCECGYPLVQRFDGLWVCGVCMYNDDHLPEHLAAFPRELRRGCPCYACRKRNRETP